MAKELETIVNISGNLEASLRNAIDQATNQLDRLAETTRETGNAYEKLEYALKDQKDALRKAQKEYAAYVLAGEESSIQAQELETYISRLSHAISGNESAMRDAEKAAQKLAGGLNDTGNEANNADDGIDRVGKAAKDSKSGFSVMKGAISNLISSGIQNLISAAGNAITSIYGLADSTQEYREDMGKLETAWESAGQSTELAAETYKNFYSVLGEEDRSVEAVNHLAKFVDTEEDIAKWTDIATGVWGTFGDSLPIEGLTEAANETAKVGDVTGVLADALNWAGVNEDDFQKSLDACATEQERSALITDTLSGLYDDAADSYRENNESIIEARKANSDYTDTLADMGEMIEPVTTAVKGGMTDLLEVGVDLMNKVDFAGFAEKASSGFSALAGFIGPVAEQALPALFDGIGTVTEAFSPLVPLVGDFASGVLPVLSSAVGDIFDALTPVIPIVVDLVSNLLPLISSLIEALAPVITTVVSALTPVLSAIGQLVSGLIPPLIKLVNTLSPVIQFLANVISGALSGAMTSILPLVDTMTATFQSLIDFIVNFFTLNWGEAWQNAIDVFSNIFGSIGNIVKAPINAVIGAINTVINGINSISISLPDWLPGDLAGMTLGFNIPTIPMLATGGFTDGVSIAGEAGTEAVISFNPAYREENIGYWARAGWMLGATVDDAGFSLTGEAGGTTVLDMGGVTFAPNISISGKTNKESVVKAIRDEYPEFLDLLEEFLLERGIGVFA